MRKQLLQVFRVGSALCAVLVGGVASAQTCDDKNTVVADVVAIDMPMVFNRLGARLFLAQSHEHLSIRAVPSRDMVAPP